MGSKNTKLHLKEMIRMHKPAIVALLETRVHSSQVLPFLENYGFSDMLVVEALGFVGGIWLLWDKNLVNVELLSMEDQVVSILVKEPLGCHWLLTVVYSSPKAYVKEELWQYVRHLGAVVHIPWVLIGDVNQTLDSCDKHGGRPVNRQLASKLRGEIEDCNLLDMGFVGPKFTWTNGR